MRLFFCTLLLFVGLGMPVWGQVEITLEDLFKKGTFKTKTVNSFAFRKDGQSFTTLTEEGIVLWDLASGQKKGLLFDIKKDGAGIGEISEYAFTPDEQRILLLTNATKIYRRSSEGQYYIWHVGTAKLTKVEAIGKQRDATVSPDGRFVAFVCKNNIYLQDLQTGKRSAITADGQVNAIINGASDWVYEEELSLTRAYEWSPDGKYLAFLRFDESKVPEFTLDYDENGVYPRKYTYKYPKVGQTNATVSAHIYTLKTKKTNKVPLAGSDFYIPRIVWANNEDVCVFQLNRLQNNLKLWLANAPRKGVLRLMYEETETEYIDINDYLTFLPNGAGFLWVSELGGYKQLYHYDMQGNLVKKLTDGQYDLTNFYGYDEKRGLCHFQAAGLNAMNREWYSVSLKGEKPQNRIGGGGWNDFQFSPNFDYYVHAQSNVNTPTRTTVWNYDGSTQRELEANSLLLEQQKTYQAQEVEFFQVEMPNGQAALNAWMIKPPNFDPKKKYPVFMYLYGGPGNQQVVNRWGAWQYWWFQMLAQKGYIVACVDNRGTGGMGEAFKKCTYKQLGKLETEDQINAAKFLGTKPYVDASRIGIFGWSYGGYMSTLCILKGNDVFKVGLAVAPVTNWKWYDSIYTERYMQTDKENAAGYETNAPIQYADRLKGKYFLAHGITDDNVHFQNSVEMANALLNANKQYDFYMYPNRNHGISGGNARLHLYTKMTNFILENL